MPLFRYLPALLLLSALPSCSSDGPAGRPANAPAAQAAPDTAAVRKAAQQYQVVLGEPVFVDSSSYYYQPVEVGMKNGGRNLRDKISLSVESSGSYGSRGQVFNLLFTHQPDQTTHLLLPHGRFLITEVNSSAQPAARYPFLFCTLVTQDFNRDGELTTSDASALYVADRDGRNLRQLPAPAGTQVAKLLVLPQSPTLLVLLRQDTDHDLEFDFEDAQQWLSYDLRNLAAGPQLHPQPRVQAQLRQQLIEFNTHLVPVH
jgi:hypothetical protein